jgi:hypothetical protein
VTTGIESATAPAPGWYPDPAGPGNMRWWSGDGWTEHLSPVVAPAEDEVPELARFARDPALRPATTTEPSAGPQRDPYRDRNILGGLALVVALASVPYTIVDALWPLPDSISLLLGGTPIALALLGLVASIKLGFSTRMAWIALVISALTMAAGFAIDAQRVSVDIPVPNVTDVPGITQIQELQQGAGLNG